MAGCPRHRRAQPHLQGPGGGGAAEQARGQHAQQVLVLHVVGQGVAAQQELGSLVGAEKQGDGQA